ncbi:1b54dd7b-283b-48d1-856e-8523fdeec0e3 [Sclerotinia trifoliorum]|uniref:1b54dd7b-283b-48d1-856e-8523fdeec0e3 n=1 Tax=Sclerotinia trifoliorum TaxID=28548 RepID=A0A8H2ZXM1_9HELO|nr:1b54dd7b-283b-48d1-856e-8523fdeec0e3 [Sclerotinia trifoliorum]
MPRSGGLIENYLDHINGSLSGSRTQNNSPTVERSGKKTLADELADLDDEFDSEEDSGDDGEDEEYSSEESETSLQREAREEVDRVVALHEKFLKDNNIRNDFVDGKNTKISPQTVPVSMAQRAFSLPETRRQNISASQTSPTRSAPGPSHKTPLRPLSFSSMTTTVRHTQVPPPGVPFKERKLIVKPPPLSRGFFATISREYGWAWLWWIIIPLLLAAVAFYAREQDLVLKQRVADARNARNAIVASVEETNANAIIDIASAISDVAKVMLDKNGTLMALKDSPFNQAVLPIASVRKTILEAHRVGRFQNLIMLIDDFVTKNRELDHDWRSFLQQQIEATAEFAGAFDGYAKNAGTQGYRTDWIKAAYNITIHDVSDISQKVRREGELLMCEILGQRLNKPSCSPDRKNLRRLHSELTHELILAQFWGSNEALEIYAAALTDIAKGTEETLKTWENALFKILAAKRNYNHEYGIGNVEGVAQKLESTAKTLTEAMESSLVYLMAAPEFPAAVRRLAESKIRTLTLQ